MQTEPHNWLESAGRVSEKEKQKMFGTVRWYSAQGYGFLDPSDGGEAVYFHIRNVIGQQILKPGETVSFDLMPSPKGVKAVQVKQVSGETKEALQCLQRK